MKYKIIVLEKTAGRKDKAAQIMGINRRTLYRKEREYGLIDQNVTDDELDSKEAGAREYETDSDVETTAPAAKE